jgi:ATP-dependent Clp protease adaptor protein ClpS
MYRRRERCETRSFLVNWIGQSVMGETQLAMKHDLEKIQMHFRSAGPGGADEGNGNGSRGTGGDTVTERRTKEKVKTQRPSMYKCILLNDDYTPMEFVVEILKTVFHRQHAEATRIMLHVHQNGMGVAGVYPFEIAETKIKTVEELAHESQYPLKCVMEKE